MSLSRTSLTTVDHYSIDILTKDPNTYAIQIVDSKDQTILADLPLDPVDNTLAGVITGNLPAPVLEALSKVLQVQIGAKEFIVLPTGSDLPGYDLAQNAEFKRTRQASRLDLEKSTSAILEKYPLLVAKLDYDYEAVSGINKPYEAIATFLKTHGDFTPEKMMEYLKGMQARFNNRNVTTVTLQNGEGIGGLIRSLSMGNKFAYLSDETVNQEILPLENFQGHTRVDQIQNRAIFLLAYLANRMAALVKDQDHFIMIAASGRENIYESVGFQNFPIKANDHVMMLKLGKPGLLLSALKDKLNNASLAAALNKFGVIGSTAPEVANVVESNQSFRRN